MKWKLVITWILLLPATYIAAQIQFDEVVVPNAYHELFNRVDEAILADEFKTVHSVLVVENGQLMFEKYYHGWPKDSVHQLQSATKSVVSALLGCAIQQGCVGSVEDSISKYFPRDYFFNGGQESITINDLLTQRHGLKWSENDWNSPENTWRKILYTTGNWYKAILQTPMDTVPGRYFNYSNAAPVLISGLIQQTCQLPIDSFAKKYLFDPLDIKHYQYWMGNGGPQHNGLALLSMTSRDMAKFGQLYLQGGTWNGRTIIPKEYIQESWKNHVDSVGANGMYFGYDYGYFWWSKPRFRLNKSTTHPDVFIARGAGGQNIIVWPTKNRVIVITAWNMAQSNLSQAIFDKYLRYL